MNSPNPDQPPASIKDAAWRLYSWLWEHRTTSFGYVVAFIGAAAEDNLLPAGVVKLVLLLAGLSTAGIGHFNQAQIRKAQSTPPESKP